MHLELSRPETHEVKLALRMQAYALRVRYLFRAGRISDDMPVISKLKAFKHQPQALSHHKSDRAQTNPMPQCL